MLTRALLHCVIQKKCKCPISQKSPQRVGSISSDTGSNKLNSFIISIFSVEYETRKLFVWLISCRLGLIENCRASCTKLDPAWNIVTSDQLFIPTFVIINQYQPQVPGTVPLKHCVRDFTERFLADRLQSSTPRRNIRNHRHAIVFIKFFSIYLVRHMATYQSVVKLR